MRETENYLRELERHLDCPRRIRKPFLDRTRQMAEDFIQGKPEATPQELIDYLGDPQDLAQGFLEPLEPDVLERHKKRKKSLLCGCIAVLFVALVGVAIWGMHLKHTPKTVEVIETLIIYSES